ncbi:MAG: hypothetical protein SFU98_00150 [Leptospiraceae bacterium]|nr:hypothetical protein [Leptospiraceae bacterium]
MKRIFLYSLLAIVLQCNNSEKNSQQDYQTSYRNRILLLYLARPTPNPQTACINSTTSSGACIIKAPDRDKVLSAVLTQEQYTVSALTLGRLSTYSAYCTESINNIKFPSNPQARAQVPSDSLLECTFNCQKTYWDTALRVGSCEKINTQLLFTDSVGKGITSCVVNCNRQTNNSLN